MRDIMRDPVKSSSDRKLESILAFGKYVTFWDNSMVSKLCV